MASEGDGAGEGEEIAEADVGEEVSEGGSGGSGEKEKAGEGEEGSDCCGPSGRRGVGRSEGWDDCEEWDEDDDQAGDEGGFCWRCVSEPCGLELVARCEEEADDET